MKNGYINWYSKSTKIAIVQEKTIDPKEVKDPRTAMDY